MSEGGRSQKTRSRNHHRNHPRVCVSLMSVSDLSAVVKTLVNINNSALIPEVLVEDRDGEHHSAYVFIQRWVWIIESTLSLN